MSDVSVRRADPNTMLLLLPLLIVLNLSGTQQHAPQSYEHPSFQSPNSYTNYGYKSPPYSYEPKYEHPNLPLNKSYCTGLTTCLDYAMNVIHTSDRYKLFESLWFDAINGTNHSYVITTSDPKNFTQLVKKATHLFDTHYLIWKIAPGLNVKVFKKDEDKFGMSVLRDVYPVKNERRTFGIGKRRIMMALLPIMYKLGVITTLLIALTVITLKGLTIGVVLLMLSFGSILTKLKGGYPEHAPQKDIHIHVHPFPGGKPEHYSSYEYSPWGREGEAPLEETTVAPPSTLAPPVAPWATGYLPPFMSL